MRHLITGGAGFVGSHLADRLAARGDEVTILDDLSTGTRANVEALLADGRARLVTASTHDAGLVNELMAGADTCFHLASSVGVMLIVEQPLDSLIRTVRGTDTVMAAAAEHRTRLLFTSTSEVYGKGAGRALREQDDRLLGAVDDLALVVCDGQVVRRGADVRLHARARRADDRRPPVQRGRLAAGERLRDGAAAVRAPGARRGRRDRVRKRDPGALLHPRQGRRRRARGPDRGGRGHRQRLQRRRLRAGDDHRTRQASDRADGVQLEATPRPVRARVR